MATYTVKSGDSLSKIAAAIGGGITWQQIYELNKALIGSNPNLIKPNQVLQLPGGSSGGGTTTPPATGDSAADVAGATTQAIPRNAKLVKVGGDYRVVWDLGGGLGFAWYSMTAEDVKRLYGTNAPTPSATFSNVGTFEGRFGNYYWGSVTEINLKAETPWEDLRTNIFSQFGFVPGFDDPEIKKLILQGYFEGWQTDQFFVEYRNTSYFKNTTDRQRQWVGLSPAEQQQQIQEQVIALSERYRLIWGSEVEAGAVQDAAFKIASGQMDISQWEYDQAQQAAIQPGTPEYTRRQQEQVQAAEGVNRVENLTLFAEQQYRAWLGPGAIPQGFAEEWGGKLATGAVSEADLEKYLKSLSSSYWTLKPPDLSWRDWSAGYKAQIGQTLELGVVDDADPLLNQILRSDLTGVDLDTMIRQDERYKSTQQMYNQLSGLATDLGKKFGFIT